MRRAALLCISLVLASVALAVPSPSRLHVLADGPAKPANTAPHATQQWDLRQIRAVKAWSITQGQGVVVCTVDTGVLPTPDLAGQIIGGTNTVYPTQPTNYADDNGHGTFTASEIVGNGTVLSGVAPKAKLWAAKVLDATGSGGDGNVVGRIYACVDHGAQVINLSLGGSAASYDGFADAISWACRKGVSIASAAGNDALDGASGDAEGVSNMADPAGVVSPCNIAVNALDRAGQLASYSNFHMQKREISAPGSNVPGDGTDGGFSTDSGTSMAAPMVSGVLALLASMHVPPSLAVQIMLETARHTATTKASRILYGAGVLDAYAAVSLAQTLGYHR